MSFYGAGNYQKDTTRLQNYENRRKGLPKVANKGKKMKKRKKKNFRRKK